MLEHSVHYFQHGKPSSVFRININFNCYNLNILKINYKSYTQAVTEIRPPNELLGWFQATRIDILSSERFYFWELTAPLILGPIWGTGFALTHLPGHKSWENKVGILVPSHSEDPKAVLFWDLSCPSSTYIREKLLLNHTKENVQFFLLLMTKDGGSGANVYNQ